MHLASEGPYHIPEPIRAFMADLERRDPILLVAWFSEATWVWVPPREPVHGARRVQAMFRAIFRKYSEIHWRVTEAHTIDDLTYVYLTESWGTTADGLPYRNEVATFVRFDAEGRIASLSDYFKQPPGMPGGRPRGARVSSI